MLDVWYEQWGNLNDNAALQRSLPGLAWFAVWVRSVLDWLGYASFGFKEVPATWLTTMLQQCRHCTKAKILLLLLDLRRWSPNYQCHAVRCPKFQSSLYSLWGQWWCHEAVWIIGKQLYGKHCKSIGFSENTTNYQNIEGSALMLHQAVEIMQQAVTISRGIELCRGIIKSLGPSKIHLEMLLI